MPEIEYLERPYSYLTPLNELNFVENLAIGELKKNNRLRPFIYVYDKNMQYALPLAQFTNQELAKHAATQLCREKNADFYIVAGMSKKNHPLDSTQDQLWLNVILHKKGKVTHRQTEVLISDSGKVSILEREQINDMAGDKDVGIIKTIMDQEDLTDSEERV
ncbi:unnamed protein product [marine sediment metagenome]|uniref:Uncharacterized protein n=1 Tax=marine sediment metagenome TaxID=412755 RepID=X0V3H1_9ZZZZ